jgi:hypothetical protein
MTEQKKLCEVLSGMMVHPIVNDMLTEDLETGKISTEKILKEKAEEYTNML